LVEEALGYDLVVYSLSSSDRDAQPVLEQSFPGQVSGWTPSLDRCFDRGGGYAWSVRAVGRADESEWSEARLFQIAEGPSLAEALEILESLVEEGPPGRLQDVDGVFRSPSGGISGDGVHYVEGGGRAPGSVSTDAVRTANRLYGSLDRRVLGGRPSTPISMLPDRSKAGIQPLDLTGLSAVVAGDSQSSVAAVRGLDDPTGSRDDATAGYLGVAVPSDPFGGPFDGFSSVGWLSFSGGGKFGLLGLANPDSLAGVAGIGTDSAQAGFFYNFDTFSGFARNQVELSTEDNAVEAYGDVLVTGVLAVEGILDLPFSGAVTSGSDTVAEAYRVTGGANPVCSASNRGAITIMKPSGAGTEDALCYCGEVNDVFDWWCFSP